MENILEKSGKKVVLLGNEAIVRGALEAGVQFVSTYPGTPASEIGNTFYSISKKKKRSFYFEFSTNEKVALEAGVGASFSNLKTLIAMKNFGLNVCQDALLPFLYTGSVGPTVIAVADDPSCHSSAQSEENSRAISYLAHIPTLEPSSPQECKDFVKLAFEMSKRFNLPIMVRLTTRVAHQRSLVKLGRLNISDIPPKGRFIRDKKRFITMPPRVLEMKSELLKKIEDIRDWSAGNKDLSFVSGLSSKKLGVITSGISYLYVIEALKRLNISMPVLKLGLFYPLPDKEIKRFVKSKERVLVVEELEPWLGNAIMGLAKDTNPKLQIISKDILSSTGELRPEMVISAVAYLARLQYKSPDAESKILLPKRYPQPCAGCPYWLAFGAIKKAIGSKEVIFGGDIGCYMLAGTPCVGLQDYLSCMGSSIGIAHGIKKSSKQKVITFIGDSTFFHAGIPALINTVVNGSNPLIIIMDNRTTAMTGHQPNPGSKVKIEEIVSACGVKDIRVIDPINQKQMIQTVKEFLKKKEASVIISRRPCIFVK